MITTTLQDQLNLTLDKLVIIPLASTPSHSPPPATPITAPLATPIAAPPVTPITAPPATPITAPATPTTPPGPQPSNYNQIYIFIDQLLWLRGQQLQQS